MKSVTYVEIFPVKVFHWIHNLLKGRRYAFSFEM